MKKQDNSTHEADRIRADMLQLIRSEQERKRYDNNANGCLYAGRAFLETAESNTDEWLELAKDAWLNSDDGKHCPVDIVNEFTANIDNVLALVRTLLRIRANYPIKYALRRPKRTTNG